MTFEQIDMEQKTHIEQIRRKAGHIPASHAFTSLFLWREQMKLSICIQNDCFCVKRDDKEPNAFFFPCGEPEQKLAMLHELMEKEQLVLYYLRVEDVIFLKQQFGDRFVLKEARDDWEYLYDRAAQVELQLGEYRNLRRKIRQIEKQQTWVVEALTAENLQDAEQVAVKWKNIHTGYADTHAVRNALDYFDSLQMTGIVLYDDGHLPVGFLAGSMISTDTYDLHITKTIQPSLDAFIHWCMYKRLPKTVRWINYEEDLGIAGLRNHKEQLHPAGYQQFWKGWMLA